MKKRILYMGMAAMPMAVFADETVTGADRPKTKQQ